MNRLLKLTLLVVGLVCLSVYGYLLWSGGFARESGQPVPPSSLAQESVDLWGAYQRARAVAEENGTSVEPMSASTQWQGATEDGLLRGTGQWSFAFYAPETSNVLDIVVTPDSARLANQTRVWDTPVTLAGAAWQEGPRDPLLIFLARGGREFLDRHEHAVVSVHLGAGKGERPLWDVAALSTGDRSVLAVRIDAETLGVESTTPGNGEGG